jgi:ribosomal protein S18 acetylase RimI-like enzyme
VDRATPEVAVAVREGHRGGGTGERLLRALAELARANGFDRLSLSVAHANPARRLYERLGYRTVAGHGDDPIMLLELR